MKKDPKELIKQIPDQEKDYISGLDEIARGIDSGIYDLQHSIGTFVICWNRPGGKHRLYV